MCFQKGNQQFLWGSMATTILCPRPLSVERKPHTARYPVASSVKLFSFSINFHSPSFPFHWGRVGGTGGGGGGWTIGSNLFSSVWSVCCVVFCVTNWPARSYAGAHERANGLCNPSAQTGEEFPTFDCDSRSGEQGEAFSTLLLHTTKRWGDLDHDRHQCQREGAMS